MDYKDIFISYRNDGSGNQFAYRLVADLEKAGYGVYFNPYEHRSHDFPERLRKAVENCRDFILVLSKGCLEQLKKNEEVDWVRDEILVAHQANKRIIPILIEGMQMPKSKDEMPESLHFLPYIDAITFPEQYIESPFLFLLRELSSVGGSRSPLSKEFNGNPLFEISEDFERVRTAAESGNEQAMYDLGMMYYYGVFSDDGASFGSSRNTAEAFRWLSMVETQATDEALRSHAKSTIARLYYAGEVPSETQSYEKAHQYDLEASAFDDYSATNLAFMMRAGLACEFDYEKTIEFYVENLQRMDMNSALALASFYMKYGKIREAIKVYESLANTSPEADYRIGLIYRDGLHTVPPMPDPIRAGFYFYNAAKENHALAAYELGMLWYRPTGSFRKDFNEAKKYLTIASDQGVSEAQYVLGYMYEKGFVEQSLEKAVHYYSMAAKQGHSYACLELAKCYQRPECLDYQLAYHYASTAAMHGTGEAELILGCLLLWGRGCKSNVNKAIELFERAAGHGHYYAVVMLEKAKEAEKRGRKMSQESMS